MNITKSGKRHLGAVVGHVDDKEEFLKNLVEKWIHQIEKLSEIAMYEPQAAYTAFTTSIRHKYTFYIRTIPEIKHLLQPLENAIRLKFIPALTDGRMCNDNERDLLSLPPRLGGSGIINLVKICEIEYEFSKEATQILTSAIIKQHRELPPNFQDVAKKAKTDIRCRRRQKQK